MFADSIREVVAPLLDSSNPVPADLDTRARWLILDTLGCAIAGGRSEPVGTWLNTHRLVTDPFGAAAERNSRETLGPAMALTMAACWDEACEGHAGAHGRPGVAAIGAIWPSVRAMTLGELIRATVVGYEVGARAGAALPIAAGMHVDANWPALGAAAAAACALGLDFQGLLTAVDITACQLPTSLYRPIQTGDTARNTYLGHAAVLGRMAAQVAAAGITAPPDAVEEYLRVTGGADRAHSALSEGHQILSGYFKEYAAVRHVHYAARAALELRSATSVEDIAEIKLWTYPEAIRYCGVRGPETPLQAQFSLSFGVAAMLRWGRLDPAVYRGDAFSDPLLRSLESRVVIHAEADWAHTRAARLTVTDRRGREYPASVTAVRGDASLPWSEADLVAKFVDYSGPSLGSGAAGALAERILRAPLSAGLFPD